MKQKKYDNYYEFFYRDSNQDRRKYGIYSPSIDRFIFVDSNDMWLVLDLAEVLSSKLSTIAYVLPSGNKLSNADCISYTIFNKTEQKIGISNIVAGKQNPVLKFIYDDDKIIEVGYPLDLDSDMYKKLIEYINFAKKHLYAVNITDAFYNFENNRKFTDKFFPNLEDKNIISRYDTSDVNQGLLNEIRRILYFSLTQEEAQEKIIDLFYQNLRPRQMHLVIGYFKVLKEPIPESLSVALKNLDSSLNIELF